MPSHTHTTHYSHTRVHFLLRIRLHLRVSLLEDFNVSKISCYLAHYTFSGGVFLLPNFGATNVLGTRPSTDGLLFWNGAVCFASELEVHSMANKESRKHARGLMASFD
jgi:hypothetical protein